MGKEAQKSNILPWYSNGGVGRRAPCLNLEKDIYLTRHAKIAADRGRVTALAA